MVALSVTIITKNEEKNILRCLESVKPVATEIVVVDSMSSDRTADICRSFGCRVFQRFFDGYGSQKQYAVEQAAHDWILSIDADEVISEELCRELLEIFGLGDEKVTELQSHRVTELQSHRVTESQSHRVTESQSHRVTELQSSTHLFTRSPIHLFAGFQIHFSLFFMGRIMKHSGVGNERHLRLFNRTKGGFTTVSVHEGIEVRGNTGTLKGRIIHYSYRDISHHLDKINVYTSQAADGYRARGKSFPKLWVSLKFPVSFFSFYVIKRGFLDGFPGFMWSFLAAVYATLKVAKTIELAQKS